MNIIMPTIKNSTPAPPAATNSAVGIPPCPLVSPVPVVEVGVAEGVVAVGVVVSVGDAVAVGDVVGVAVAGVTVKAFGIVAV